MLCGPSASEALSGQEWTRRVGWSMVVHSTSQHAMTAVPSHSDEVAHDEWSQSPGARPSPGPGGP